MIKVVAAVIRRGQKILICRRPEGKNLAGYWEFASGKVEEGESKRQALVRECREELGVTLSVGAEIFRAVHDYPQYSVDISFFDCTIYEGQPVAKEHSRIEWVGADELKDYNFCPADGDLIEILSRGQSGI